MDKVIIEAIEHVINRKLIEEHSENLYIINGINSLQYISILVELEKRFDVELDEVIDEQLKFDTITSIKSVISNKIRK